MSKRRNPPDGDMVAQLAEVASLSRPISYPPMKSLDGSREHLSPKHRQNLISHATRRTMVVASSTNAASSTPSGGGSAAPSVSSAPPARNDCRSSSDESEEEEAEWQPTGSKEASPNSETQSRAPTPPSKPSGSASDNSPLDTDVRSSSGMPVVIDIPPGESSDITVRVVSVPATENHNDGRTFLQDGFGGLEALVQMESRGATELAVLYDFFDDNDVIGDFILTPRETLQTATELSSQLKNFAVKREFASILSQFDSNQLTLRTFGTCPFSGRWLPSTAGSNASWRRRRRGIGGRAARRSPATQARPAIPVKLLDREGGGSPEGKEYRRGANAFGLRSPDGGARERYVKPPQSSPDSQDGVGDGTGVPTEWQTVITVMANDNLAFQAPPFVRMDPPQDEDDEETKESDPPAPDSFLDLPRGASTTKFGSKSSQLDKRVSGSQSPKSHKKPAPDGVQELPSKWVGSTSPCRPEEVPLPLSPAQARASLADYPVVWKDLRRRPDEARRPHYTRSVPDPMFSRLRPEPSRPRHPEGALRRGGVEGLPGDASLNEVVRYPAYGIFLPSPGGLGARSGPGVGGLGRLHGGERGSTLARDSIDRVGPRLLVQVHPED
ncbi:unnamed protein product [Phytophthora fragariaefolia]|uniref:Unnamed protein product n=1 Tax=Phytophthora fragariaefolia TaxID=1490495 RepID=A0A9W6XKP0_9STRA|nr:unnamed protein product [Phytophthora fragariaefolia]